MKTIIAYITFFGIIINGLNAQFLDQGNFLIGSTFGLSTSNSKISKTVNGQGVPAEGPTALQFSIAPDIGYFLFDNFTLGMGVDYTYSQVEEPDRDKTDDSDLLFGPFFRYYLPVENDIAFFVETNFGFGNATDNQVVAGEQSRIETNIFAIGAGPGITIFSSNGIGIEAIFKYNFAQSKFDIENLGVTTSTTTKTNQFDISIGVQLYFARLERASN